MLVDTSECIGCKGCEVACKQWNQNEARINQDPGTYQSHPALDAETWTVIRFFETEEENGMSMWLMQKHSCMHCTDAGCVTACPTDALQYGDYGLVTLNQEACIGCGYCEAACPFDCIHVDRTAWGQRAQKAGKCTFCYDRIAQGMQPACVATCPTDCIKYGDRDALIAWGRERVASFRPWATRTPTSTASTRWAACTTSTCCWSRPRPTACRWPPKLSPVLRLWKYGLQPIGKAALGVGLFGLIVNWLAARRVFKGGLSPHETAESLHD
ncbi:MAG: hypothetical protein A6D92_05955 [Symbiobacterium thermophilum]|uniref:4Fe-4S ferredoxin-type domain-containing protein n=1 Tax=Symbiobacterium thermophilum TaxID=2734 RepID=A0A1Y2T6X8_SYMTR|nr:MAG: hypothetical protein A6D92_05955 [Symbiobacterium thermophilum]